MYTENVYAHTRLNAQKDEIKMVIVCHVSRNVRLWVQFDKFPLITILLRLNFFFELILSHTLQAEAIFSRHELALEK